MAEKKMRMGKGTFEGLAKAFFLVGLLLLYLYAGAFSGNVSMSCGER